MATLLQKVELLNFKFVIRPHIIFCHSRKWSKPLEWVFSEEQRSHLFFCPSTCWAHLVFIRYSQIRCLLSELYYYNASQLPFYISSHQLSRRIWKHSPGISHRTGLKHDAHAVKDLTLHFNTSSYELYSCPYMSNTFSLKHRKA